MSNYSFAIFIVITYMYILYIYWHICTILSFLPINFSLPLMFAYSSSCDMHCLFVKVFYKRNSTRFDEFITTNLKKVARHNAGYIEMYYSCGSSYKRAPKLNEYIWFNDYLRGRGHASLIVRPCFPFTKESQFNLEIRLNMRN